MKNISLFLFFIFSTANIFAQKVFDIATYTAPAAWKKAKIENAIQVTKEDAATERVTTPRKPFHSCNGWLQKIPGFNYHNFYPHIQAMKQEKKINCINTGD